MMARIFAFLTAIPFHEAAHAFVSDKLGDPTARNLGRLTLNPLKHIDPFGLLAMLVVGIGWAKPVPINPAFYKKRKVGMAITAAAGPLSNLLMGFVVFLGAQAIKTFGTGSWVATAYLFFWYLALININLAVFNLIPIPPFDGSRIFGLILPEKIYFGIQKYERYIMMAVMVIMVVLPRFTKYNPIGVLLSAGNRAVMSVFEIIAGLIGLA